MDIVNTIISNISLGTVLTSLITALTVTLLYDFLLKPILESRKEEICRKAKNWQDIINSFKLIGSSSGMLARFDFDFFEKNCPEFLPSHLQNLQKYLDDLIFNLHKLDIKANDTFFTQLFYVLSFMKGLVISTLKEYEILLKNNDTFEINIELKINRLVDIVSKLYLFDTYFQVNMFLRKFFKLIYKKERLEFVNKLGWEKNNEDKAAK